MATAFSDLVRVDYVKVTREWNAESDGSLRKVRERDGGVGDAVRCRVLFMCGERAPVK